MAHYLLQVSYSRDAWAALILNPQDRGAAVRGPIEKLGGQIGQLWLAFGDDDIVAIVEMPNNIAAAAISIAFSAGGACKKVKTTPLMSIQEGMEAMKKAGECGYQPASRAASA